MSELCVKCGNAKSIILVGTNGKFCKECFESYFSHKFRASLGKNPIVRHGQRVAIAFSGGNNSSALLSLLLEAMSPNAFKRVKFHPGIIFVDETSVLPNDDYSSKLIEVTSIMQKTGLPFEIIKLEEVLRYHKTESTETGDVRKARNLKDGLRALVDSVESVTCKEELLYRMKCKLLAWKAKELGYQHVFLGETSSRLAVNILSNIAQGRGAHLPLDTGFDDGGRFEGMNLLRPLRDITAKEIAVYNAIHKVSTVFFPSLSTKLPRNASIQRLTEDFIVTLSANFPSTETTVYRTSNKLQMMKDSGKSSHIASSHTNKRVCQLCCGPLDTNLREDQAMALGAMNFTQMLCAGQCGVPDDPDILSMVPLDETSMGRTGNGSMKNMIASDDIQLCHACTILKKGFKTEASIEVEETFEQLLTPVCRKLTPDDLNKNLDNISIDS